MAGDWIKLELTTPDKPEVHLMAADLGISAEQVLGGLCRIWIWADQQSLDGNALSVTENVLDSVARVPNLGRAMRKAGWLRGENGALALPNFDAHNGQTAKKRALTARRAATHRQRDSNADGVTSALPREEKRRSKDIAPKAAGKKPIPEGWIPTEPTVEKLSREFGLVPEDVGRYVAAFHDACRAKDYRYKDFDAAFSNCVRQDWPKFRNGAKTMPKAQGAGW